MHHVSLKSVVALSVVLWACGGTSKYGVQGTARAKRTSGVVEVEQIEGSNQLLTLLFEDLPPPAQLGSGLTTYVVWLQASDAVPRRSGALAYDEETHTGNLMATTTQTRFVLKVTAESDPNVRSPSKVLVAERYITIE